MATILQFKAVTKQEDLPFQRNPEWNSYSQVEHQGKVLIQQLLRETSEHAESILGRTIDDGEFDFYALDIEMQMEDLLKNINLPPRDEEYIESTEFKVAVFKQRIEEGRFREKLLGLFEEM